MQRFTISIQHFLHSPPGAVTKIRYAFAKQSSLTQSMQDNSQQTAIPANEKLQASKVAKSGRGKIVVALSLIFFLVIIFKDAWLSDDAYITFRTVDNFINGYGLTWNTDERVQVYTHPLWMFLISAVYFFTRHIYYSAVFLSIAISFIAIAIVAFRLARSPYSAALGILILAASKSFVDFSPSGLENPLTNLLIVLFMLVFFTLRTGTSRCPYRACKSNTRSIFWPSLIAALAP